MTIDSLPAFCSSLVTYLTLPASITATGVGSVIRLFGGDLEAMMSPSIGVFLQVPDPTAEEIRLFGNDAMHTWKVNLVIVSDQTISKEAGLVYCLQKARIVKGLIDYHPTRAFDAMHLQAEPLSIFKNDASSTIIYVQYGIIVPF